MNWQILYIPGKQEHSKQLSTVDVFVSQVEPKLANTLVRKLNQIAPLENLRHVKRVRKITTEGKAQLSMVLCHSFGQENGFESVPHDVLELIRTYKLQPFVAKVAKYAALSKDEWEEQCKLWPTSYHPPTYNIDGITGFTEDDSQTVFNFIKVALKLAEPSNPGEQAVNAAVIVDPSTRNVIASACDQTCSRLTSANKNSLDSIECIEWAEIISSRHSDATKEASNEPVGSKYANADQRESYAAVSCLHPWRWIEQQPSTQQILVKCGSTFAWHPLQHAALVAIENAAARDRQLFPTLEPSKDRLNHMDDQLQSFSMALPVKRQKTQLSSDDKMVSNASSSELPSEVMRPYLCTGFDIYLVWEPCTMCAMALVHQRIRRIFYAFPNLNAGALGSVYRLQGERSLNHHYAVFRVLLPEEVIRDWEFNSNKNSHR